MALVQLSDFLDVIPAVLQAPHRRDRPGIDSREISEGMVVDYDTAGCIVGIDIDNAGHKIELERVVLKKLPGVVEPADREFIAERIDETLDQETAFSRGPFATPELAQAWADEVGRRIDMIDKGLVKPLPADVALREAREHLERF